MSNKCSLLYLWWWLSDFRAYEPYTLSGIPSGKPPSCETPRQPTIYAIAIAIARTNVPLSSA